MQALMRSQGDAEAAAEAEREWRAARDDYQASAAVFQRSRNLSGAIFASSNAALISAQLGNDSIALQVQFNVFPANCVAFHSVSSIFTPINRF
jgi:hypothetical protein